MLLPDDGAIGLFGWGGGTAARLLCEAYDPPPRMRAWEPDARVLDACRLGMGLADVERAANSGGASGNGGGDGDGGDGGGGLELRVGSPFDPAADGGAPEGAFAGIIVDLFAGGRLPPELLADEAWEAVRARLKDPARGRVMARLGPAARADGGVAVEAVLALNAMARVFGGEREGERGGGEGEEGGRERKERRKWAAGTTGLPY